jgi:hypothetical protein
MNFPKANTHCKANVKKNFETFGNLAVPSRSKAERGIAPHSIQPSIRPQFLGDIIPKIPCSIKTLPCNALPGFLAGICRKALGC